MMSYCRLFDNAGYVLRRTGIWSFIGINNPKKSNDERNRTTIDVASLTSSNEGKLPINVEITKPTKQLRIHDGHGRSLSLQQRIYRHKTLLLALFIFSALIYNWSKLAFPNSSNVVYVIDDELETTSTQFDSQEASPRSDLNTSNMFLAPPRVVEGKITHNTFKMNPGARKANVKCAGADFKMYVHDPKICRFISAGLLRGGWECNIIESIVKIMTRKPDGERGHFMDIGSNIGTFSLNLAHKGFNVVAFEAMEFNIELQAASIGTYGIADKVHLFHAAVSSAPGPDLCIRAAPRGSPKINAGNGQIMPTCRKGDEHIRVLTIDSLLASEPSLQDACFTVIKADVEGYEALALMGAKGVFSGACPPCAIFMEYDKAYTKRATGSETAPFDFLRQYSYKCRNTNKKDWKCLLTAPEHQQRCFGR